MYDEQTEDLENPLRCPIKLYDYYLFKWWVTLCHVLFTWMWELPHRTNMKSPELVWELRVFFDHQPKTFLHINSPLLSAALKASRDGTMPTTWCQRPWWRPTAQCGTRLSRSRASRWSRCSPASSWCGRSRRSSTLPQGTRAPCLDSWRVYFKTMQYPHCLSISKQIEIHYTPVIIPHRVYDDLFSWLFFFPSLSPQWDALSPDLCFCSPETTSMEYWAHCCWAAAVLSSPEVVNVRQEVLNMRIFNSSPL